MGDAAVGEEGREGRGEGTTDNAVAEVARAAKTGATAGAGVGAGAAGTAVPIGAGAGTDGAARGILPPGASDMMGGKESVGG